MTRNFIIVEPDPIVSLDIEGMLIAQYPDAHIAFGASLTEIGAAIYNCTTDTTLVVKGSLILESDDLDRVVKTAATRGSKIVIIGDVTELDFPARFVALPFTTDMVLAAVDGNVPDAEPDLVP